MNNRTENKKADLLLLAEVLIWPIVAGWILIENKDKSDLTYLLAGGILILAGPFLWIFKDLLRGDEAVISLYSDLFSGGFIGFPVIHKLCIAILILSNMVGIISIFAYLIGS